MDVVVMESEAYKDLVSKIENLEKLFIGSGYLNEIVLMISRGSLRAGYNKSTI